MKTIPLTKDKFVMVDDEDFEWLSQWKWQAQKAPRTFYAVRTDYSNGGKKKITLHRLLVDCENKFVDHRDNNGLNCQKNNLRPCSRTENNRNKKSSGYSSYLGVTFKKQSKRWVSRIMVQRKSIHLGYFSTEQEAALKYNNEAIKYFGEFANLNLVKGGSF